MDNTITEDTFVQLTTLQHKTLFIRRRWIKILSAMEYKYSDGTKQEGTLIGCADGLKYSVKEKIDYLRPYLGNVVNSHTTS